MPRHGEEWVTFECQCMDQHGWDRGSWGMGRERVGYDCVEPRERDVRAPGAQSPLCFEAVCVAPGG